MRWLSPNHGGQEEEGWLFAPYLPFPFYFLDAPIPWSATHIQGGSSLVTSMLRVRAPCLWMVLKSVTPKMKIDCHSRWPKSKQPRTEWHVYASNYPGVPKSQMFALRWAAHPSNWISISCVGRRSCQGPGRVCFPEDNSSLPFLLAGSHSTWGRFRFFFLLFFFFFNSFRIIIMVFFFSWFIPA